MNRGFDEEVVVIDECLQKRIQYGEAELLHFATDQCFLEAAEKRQAFFAHELKVAISP